MQNLIRGQKVDLTKNSSLINVKIGLGWDVRGSNTFDLDAVALLVDNSGKLNGLQNIVFYNNRSGNGGAVQLSADNRTGAGNGDDEEININLNQIPSNIAKVVLAVNIYDAVKKRQNFGMVSNAYARVINRQNGQELYRYNLENDFSKETTIIVGEIYRHNNEWKFGAIGRGINDGFSGLCSLYNFQVNPADLVKSTVINKGNSTNNNSASSSTNSINLSKIELKKSGDKINLNKTNQPLGEILVNLNWNQKSGQSNRGFLSSIFASGNNSVDLDLGCLFELEDGYKGVVQALGNSFGNLNNEPYIHLDKDDRTGASIGGENLRINGNKVPKFKRILVFAFIYQGVANWAEVDGVVTIKQQNGPDIVVRLDEHRQGKGMCAIAMLENVENQTLSVKKLVQYFSGHEELDRAFNWGMRWRAGSK